MSVFKIALADDHVPFRKELSDLLNQMEGVTVDLQGSGGYDLITQLNAPQQQLPDLIILDLNMPGMNGFEATRQLKKSFPQIKILVLSVHTDQNIIHHLHQLGADAYINKDSEPHAIQEAVRKLMG